MTPTGEHPGSEQIARRYETTWAIFMVAVIFLLLAIIVFTGLHWASMPPSRVEVIDSSTLHLRGEFVEDNLGTEVDGAGHVTVRVLAEQYAFRPHCLVLPQGVPVTFRSTSSDAIHGLQIMGTNVNTMVIPGYVSTFVATLNAAANTPCPVMNSAASGTPPCGHTSRYSRRWNSIGWRARTGD